MANNVNISLLLKTKGFTKGLKNAQQSLKQFDQVAMTVGRTMQYALGGGIILAAGQAGKAAIEFDRASSKLLALTGNEKDMNRLAESARNLGANSLYTAAQVAEAQLQLKRLGTSVDDIDKVDDVLVKLATALDQDVVSAADLAVKTINKFGNSFKDLPIDVATEQIGNSFVQALNDSALTVESLTASLNYVGAEADKMGFSFSEVVAILGVLANRGFEGSRAGTVLRKTLTEMAAAGGDVRQNFYNLISSGKQFNDFIEAVGIRASGGAASLEGMGEEIKEFSKRIDDADGILDRFADVLGNDLVGNMKELTSATQEAAQKLLDELKPALKGIITSLTDAVRGFTASDAAALKASVGVLALVKAFRLIKGLLGRGALGLVGFVKNLTPMGAALTAATAGATFLAAEFAAIKSNVDAAKKSIEDFSNGGTGADFITKIQKGELFGSQAEFERAAQDYIDTLQKGIDELDLRKAFNLSNADVARLQELAGQGVTEVVSTLPTMNGDDGGRNQNLQDALDAILAIESARDQIAFIEGLMVDATAGAKTFWATNSKGGENATKAAKDLIAEFEAINGTPLADGTLTDRYEDIQRIVGILKDEQTELERKMAEQLARGEKISEADQKRLDDNKLLREYYAFQNNELTAQYDLMVKMEKAREKGVRTMGVTNEQMDAHKRKAREMREEQQRLLEVYQGFSPAGQDFVEDMGLEGKFAEAVELTQQLQGELQSTFSNGFQRMGEDLTRALLDPTIKMGEALKEWGKQMLITIAGIITKYMTLGISLKIANKLSGGLLKLALKMGALGADTISGIVNGLGGQNFGTGAGSNIGGGLRTTGYISGSDLVLGTSRGINARDRIFG